MMAGAQVPACVAAWLLAPAHRAAANLNDVLASFLSSTASQHWFGGLGGAALLQLRLAPSAAPPTPANAHHAHRTHAAGHRTSRAVAVNRLPERRAA